MLNELTQILIFKTDIETEDQKQRVRGILDQDTRILQWNVDQQDIDCVLRIVTDSLTPDRIISIIQEQGHICSELE